VTGSENRIFCARRLFQSNKKQVNARKKKKKKKKKKMRVKKAQPNKGQGKIAHPRKKDEKPTPQKMPCETWPTA